MALCTLVTLFVGACDCLPSTGAVLSAWPQCLAPTCSQLQQMR